MWIGRAVPLHQNDSAEIGRAVPLLQNDGAELQSNEVFIDLAVLSGRKTTMIFGFWSKTAKRFNILTKADFGQNWEAITS